MEERSTKISVRVQPNASQNKVSGFKDGELLIRIAAPPVKGKANQELIKFLSDILGLGRGRLSIKKGLTSKMKVISIDGLTQSQVMGRLEKLYMMVEPDNDHQTR